MRNWKLKDGYTLTQKLESFTTANPDIEAEVGDSVVKIYVVKESDGTETEVASLFKGKYLFNESGKSYLAKLVYATDNGLFASKTEQPTDTDFDLILSSTLASFITTI